MTADPRDILERREIEAYWTWAERLADRARQIFRHHDGNCRDVESKYDGSPITTLDRRIEEMWRAEVGATFPEHGVLGEEFPPTNPTASWQWIFDPIDGTEEFIHRLPFFGCILALHYQGNPVVAVIDHPMLDRRCSAAYARGTIENGRRVTCTYIP